MTDDALRKACEELLGRLYKYRGVEADVDDILAFAKQQRAAVLQEEAAYWRGECGLFGPVVQRCDARAKELES